MELSAVKIFRYIIKHKRVLLTGAGGVGKSHLTMKIISIAQNPIVLGTTGIAANNIGGETIHSFFKLGISKNITELQAYTNTQIDNICHNFNKKELDAKRIFFSKLEKNIDTADIIIIDEVSMMSKELLKLVEYRLQELGRAEIPILFVGDFYQLKPVKGKYIFENEHFRKIPIINLTEIKRTSNAEFAKIQQEVRVGNLTDIAFDFIKNHSITSLNNLDKEKTILMPTNAEVTLHNNTMLDSLDGKIYSAKPRIEYKDPNIIQKQVDDFIDSMRIEPLLRLKVGAKIVFIANSVQQDSEKFYNGELGEIIKVEKGCITIKSLSKSDVIYEVSRMRFSKHKVVTENNRVKLVDTLAVSAYPVRLGYAITIHKSQGMTLPEGHIACKKIFSPEQFYVAMSRVSNPDELSIYGFSKDKHIGVDKSVQDFYANANYVELVQFQLEEDMKDTFDACINLVQNIDNVTEDTEIPF